MKHEGAGMLQPHHAAHHDQSSNEQHRNPAHEVILSRSDLCDQRTKKQSHKQAADVRGIIGASDHCSKEEVVSDKYDYTAQRSTERGAGQRKLAQIKRCDQGPAIPKIAPEAPTLKMTGFQIRLARLAANPLIRYTAANVQ